MCIRESDKERKNFKRCKYKQNFNNKLYIVETTFCGIFAPRKNCGAKETAVARKNILNKQQTAAASERLGKQVSATTDTHATDRRCLCRPTNTKR
jgi:hypothetical protein